MALFEGGYVNPTAVLELIPDLSVRGRVRVSYPLGIMVLR